jgi:hypothetical protein
MRFAVLLVGACTTLGPMPATTGVSAVPIGRPGVEGTLGPVPGFFASGAAQNKATGTPIMAASVLLDLDRWLPAKGILVGGRLFGKSGDTPGEPYGGYRRKVNDSVSIAGIAFGSTKRAESKLANYHGVRLGAEAAFDMRLWKPASWLSVHAQGAASITRILISGNYCVDAMGVAKDCNEMDPTMNTVIGGKTTGVYPAGTGTIALDLGAHRGVFNSARIALLGAVGTMPLVVGGEKTETKPYLTLGLTLSIGLGLGRPEGADDAEPDEFD